MNLRQKARESVERARAELSSDDDARVPYAALELREAMEALTYERALAYEEEIPPEHYETWQPKKVLAFLLEIDPMADKGPLIKIGVEKEFGKPPDEMVTFGKETPLSLPDLKKHYDALGSYLHLPTWKKLGEGEGHDLAKLRNRCAAIAKKLDEVLASPVFNVTLGSFASAPCGRCKETIRKRVPPGVEAVEARCFGCGAGYVVSSESNGQVSWKAMQHEVGCPSDGCEEKAFIWADEMKYGTTWTCKGCGQKLAIRFAIAAEQAHEG